MERKLVITMDFNTEECMINKFKMFAETESGDLELIEYDDESRTCDEMEKALHWLWNSLMW